MLHISTGEIQDCALILTKLVNDIGLYVFNWYHHLTLRIAKICLLKRSEPGHARVHNLKEIVTTVGREY